MKAKVISVDKIWDKATHSALPDLVRYHNKWFCVLRESDKHVYGENGTIRLLMSRDAVVWEDVHYFVVEGIDLRDPRLCVMPDGRLQLLVAGSVYDQKEFKSRQTLVSFSSNGTDWDPFQPIIEENEWLWRLTWHNNHAYGVSYCDYHPENPNAPWTVKLYEGDETGLNFHEIHRWKMRGYPNEATVRVLDSEEMVILLRRDNMDREHAWIGTSKKPYNKWSWKETSYCFGGPNFITLDKDRWLAGGRISAVTPYGTFHKTALCQMSRDDLRILTVLPSDGDNSYPAMVFYRDILWFCYYSSHEGDTAVYLARIAIDY